MKTNSPYSEAELNERKKAYIAAGRSTFCQCFRYWYWLYDTAKYESEREYLRNVILRLSSLISPY